MPAVHFHWSNSSSSWAFSKVEEWTTLKDLWESGFAFSHLHACDLCVPENFLLELFASVSSSMTFQETSLAWRQALGTSPIETLGRTIESKCMKKIIYRHCLGDISYTFIQPPIFLHIHTWSQKYRVQVELHTLVIWIVKGNRTSWAHLLAHFVALTKRAKYDRRTSIMEISSPQVTTKL